MPGERAADGQIRRRATSALVGTAVLLAVLAVVLSYSGRVLLRPQPFADRAVASLRDRAVQDQVADSLTDALVRARGDLVAVRPIVRSFAGAVVSSEAFAAIFRRALLEGHAALVDRSPGTLVVSVADAGVLFQGLLERFAPDAARRISAERAAAILTWRPSGEVHVLVRAAARVYSAAWVLAALAVLVGAGAVFLSPVRRHTLKQLGFGLMASGLAVVALLTVGRAIAVQAASPGRGAVVGALWNSFLGGLRVQALLLAAAGAVGAAAASSRVHPEGLAGGATAPGRLARATGLLAVGVLIVTEPAAATTTAVLALGLFVIYRGAAAVLSEFARASAAPARLRGVRRIAPLVIAVAAVAGAVTLIATGWEAEEPPVAPLACNGHVALCGRKLNDVALAATHNSMASVTIPTWLFGQQDGTIDQQLRDGIHGLLIDTYYGEAVPGGVRTNLRRLPKREVAVREIGAPAVDAAERIRARLGSPAAGKPGIFLCHGFCELGAVTLASALSDLRSFLVANPGEVMVVINQDEGVSPTDIEHAFDRAGLLDLVYRGPLGPFPTLRAMIDSGQRLVVLAENDAGNVPWYRLAYEHVLQETPFKFRTAAELTEPAQLATSCRPNRGPASAPLFLLNNWVDTTPTPRPSMAANVNARAALLARAEACGKLRHRLANLVAVDFYRHGDLLGVVNALNGVSR